VEGQGTSGKFSCRVQDLMPQVKYRVYLVYTKGSSYGNIDVGLLDVDEKGRGELRCNLTGEDFPNVAAIVIVAGSVETPAEMISPLSGYNKVPVPWRHSFMKPESKPEPKPEPTPEPPPSPEPIVDTPTTPNMAEIFEHSAPWEPDNPKLAALNLKWVRSTNQELLAQFELPFAPNDPFAVKSWDDYGYFIVGAADGVYAVGLPGTFSPDEETHPELTFFETKKSSEDNTDEGYWIDIKRDASA